MEELTHYINGQRVKGGSGRFADVFNPATGEVQAKVPLATVEEVNEAVAKAAEAQVAWAATNPQRRARVMMAFGQLINENMDMLAESVSPRCTSPRPSGSVLPCSRLTLSASMSMFSLIRRPKAIITRARRCGLVAAQATCASAAFATASFTSSTVASGTFAWTSPVAGLKTSANRPEPPLTRWPLI